MLHHVFPSGVFFCPEGEGIRLLLNVGKFLADYKMSWGMGCHSG
jgi:hypothetical protein